MDNTEERRQTQEVAIARLEVNVEYIKTGLDEIRNQLKTASCHDCEAMQYVKRFEVETNKKFDSVVSTRRFTITTIIAIASLGLVLLQVLLKFLKVI